jgi:hypothetical protein
VGHTKVRCKEPPKGEEENAGVGFDNAVDNSGGANDLTRKLQAAQMDEPGAAADPEW